MLFFLVLVGLTALPATAQQPRQQRTSKYLPAKIGDVAWIAGHWAMERGGRLEEIWSKPDGNCMVGMFRWVKQDKVWIYEILTIREESGTLVFRFRHFSDELDAWEPKAEPLTYRLSSIKDDEVVFTNPDSDKYRMISFTRDNDKQMTVRVGTFHDGKLQTTEFSYHRSD